MSILDHHNALLPKPLKRVTETDIGELVVSLYDNTIGILLTLRPVSSQMKVRVDESELTVSRPTESLRRIPDVSHSVGCGGSSSECIACLLSSIAPRVRMEQDEPIPASVPRQTTPLRPTSQRVTSPKDEPLHRAQVPPVKGYPMVPLHAEPLPFPKQYMTTPQHNIRRRTRVQFHPLVQKKSVQKEMEESPEQREETSLFVSDATLFDEYGYYFSQVPRHVFISHVLSQVNKCDYDFGVFGGVRGVSDTIEAARALQAISDASCQGKLIVPNEPQDPSEGTFVQQLQDTFFDQPLPFLNGVEDRNDRIILSAPSIAVGSLRDCGGQRRVELTALVSWEGLQQWESQQLCPYSYRKDVSLVVVVERTVSPNIAESLQKEVVYQYTRMHMGRAIAESSIHYVSDAFDETVLCEVFKGQSERCDLARRTVVIFTPKPSPIETVACLESLKCRLNMADVTSSLGDETYFVPLQLITQCSLHDCSVRLCLSMYNSIRRYHPSQYPQTTTQGLPAFDQTPLLYEPSYIIVPTTKTFVNKLYITIKRVHGGYISSLINYTGELQEMAHDTTLVGMWGHWLELVQYTTKKDWGVTFLVVGDINAGDMKELREIKERTLKEFGDTVSSMYISSCQIHGSMVVSENDYEQLMDSGAFYRLRDTYAPSVEVKGEQRATYYSLLPSLTGESSGVGGYSIDLYDPDEEELGQMMQQLHSLSFLNCDPVSRGRWSLLPKGVYMVQRADLLMDLCTLCDN